MDPSKEIDDIASAWITRQASGGWVASDGRQLESWLRASTYHRVAYLRLKRVWEETGRLSALGAGVNGDEPPPPGHWNLTPFFGRARSKADRPLRRRFVFAAAASVLLAVVVATGLIVVPGAKAYQTPVGGLTAVPMVDGSKVTLNTDSRIRMAVTETERRIELKQGEAFFEVAKDPLRPFVVEAGGKRVIAVGTKFSVRRGNDDIRVVVTEGMVRIDDVFLPAGSVASAGEAGVSVQTRGLSEVEEQLSWRTGMLVFHDRTLADAIAEVNRYNERRFVIADPAIAGLLIGGSFRATNVDELAELLQKGYPVDVERTGEQIVLTHQKQGGVR
jgi:transmembrane sensor